MANLLVPGVGIHDQSPSIDSNTSIGHGNNVENLQPRRSLKRKSSGDILLGLCARCLHAEEALFRPAPTPAERAERAELKERRSTLGISFMPPWRSARHHLSFKDLETSAKDGCEFCELLKDGILDTYTRRDPEDFKSHKDARDELFEEDSCSHAGKESKRYAYTSDPEDRLDYGQYILRLSGGRGPTCVRYGGNEWGL